MAAEIERKFLVRDRNCIAGVSGQLLVQGYLAKNARVTVRVRIGGEQAWLTIKSPTQGISREELEYPMPLADAEYCLAQLCDGPSIRKCRYRVPFAGHVWEVDVFEGDNAGLVLAEIELAREDEPFERPPWVGEDVSRDARYFNSQLAAHPYTAWPTPSSP